MNPHYASQMRKEEEEADGIEVTWGEAPKLLSA